MSGFLSGRTSLTTVQTADIAANAIDGTLTKDALVGDYSDVTITAADLLLYGDATDSNNTKRDTVQGVLDLAGGGGLVFINSTDISDAATYNFTATSASSYDGYHFLLQNIIPVTDDVQLHARTSTNGGSSYDSGASDYAWHDDQFATYTRDDADDSIILTGNTSGTAYTVGSAANEPGVSGWIWLMGPHLTGYTAMSATLNTKSASTYYIGNECFSWRLEAADVDAFQLFYSSGNIESGTITVYGLANA